MGVPNFGQRDCGTSGANGQAELLEEGWALQVLEGTNSLGKRSVVSSWRHKFLEHFGLLVLSSWRRKFPGNFLPFTNSLENVALATKNVWALECTNSLKNRAFWALECTNSLK